MAGQIYLSQNELVACVGDLGIESKGYEILSAPERVRTLRDTIQFTNVVIDSDVDTLIFLDKSARPISWLFRNLWDLTQDEERPEVKFLNFGKEKRREPLADPAVLESEMRNIFTIPNSEATYLDDKQVMVVDEYSSSGRTLEAARKIVDSVFADRAKLIMSEDVMFRAPPWYRASARMSGVFERDPHDLLAHALRADVGLSLSLRNDMRLMAEAAAKTMELQPAS